MSVTARLDQLRAMRKAEAERHRQPNKKPVMYASFESHPARIDTCYCEAWVLFGNDWCELNASDVLWGAAPMFKDRFEKTYRTLPALPEHAFSQRNPGRSDMA
jgi:hypothetical protein